MGSFVKMKFSGIFKYKIQNQPWPKEGAPFRILGGGSVFWPLNYLRPRERSWNSARRLSFLDSYPRASTPTHYIYFGNKNGSWIRIFFRKRGSPPPTSGDGWPEPSLVAMLSALGNASSTFELQVRRNNQHRKSHSGSSLRGLGSNHSHRLIRNIHRVQAGNEWHHIPLASIISPCKQ